MIERSLWSDRLTLSSLLRRDNGRDLNHRCSPEALWVILLFFLASSSCLFAYLFEWDRYQIITGPRWQGMSFADKGLLFWLLAAKSVAWFLPLLMAASVLIKLGLPRAAVVILNFFWIIVFYVFAIDLVCVSFAGYHAWDYLPNIQDMLDSPDQRIWQWAGERLTTEAALIFAIFAVSGPICFFCVKRMALPLVSRLRWLNSGSGAVMLTGVFLFGVLGVVPAMGLFNDYYALDRIYSAMPLTAGLRECFRSYADRPPGPEKTHTASASASLSAMSHPLALSVAERLKLSTHHHLKDSGLFPLGFGHDSGPARAFEEAVSPSALAFPTESKRYEFFSPTGTMDGQIAASFRSTAENWGRLLGLGHPKPSLFDLHARIAPQDSEPGAMQLVRDAADPLPVDTSAYVTGPRLPNVIMIIFESFRHHALGPGLMKELDAWTKQGLRLQRHYSGSNCSHLGLFSLLYGRTPLGYHQTLDRKVPSQMLESLRRSGYQITLLESGELKGFRRLDQFMNEQSCDHVINEGEFTLAGMQDWPDSDRRKLENVRRIVNNAHDKPQFVFFYLLSSHYRYPFPPEFEIFKESPGFWQFLTPWAQIQNHLNRYANACLFLEHEVMSLVKSIDLTRNIVVITGDHGESMGEDGVFTHATRMSEIQLRVPFAMVGAGVEPREVSTATVHTDVLPTLLHALAGKQVPIRNCHGRDILAEEHPADEVVVVPANGPQWEGFMIIREGRRIVFKASAALGGVPTMEFAGLVDRAGQFELRAGDDDGVRHALNPNH